MTGPPDDRDPHAYEAAAGRRRPRRWTWKIVSGVLAVPSSIVLGAVADREPRQRGGGRRAAHRQPAGRAGEGREGRRAARREERADRRPREGERRPLRDRPAARGGQRSTEVRRGRRDGHRERRRDGRRRCAGRVEPAPRHCRRGEPAGGRAGRAGGDPEQGDRQPHHRGRPAQPAECGPRGVEPGPGREQRQGDGAADRPRRRPAEDRPVRRRAGRRRSPAGRPGLLGAERDAITQDCTAAQAALDDYNAKFGS